MSHTGQRRPGDWYTLDLDGKILVVTGSSGIGAAAARLAVQAGARVVIATGDEVSGIELAGETGAELWTGELARRGAAESVLSLCLSKFARVDALFNAAGLSGRRFGDGPVDECTDEGWETTLAQNLEITFRMCRAVVGRMLEQAAGEDGVRGAIVNMGSALAEAPEPRHFAHHAYAAAKGGVVALSRAMAAYYAPQGIRVNVLAPAVVRTPASERAGGDPEFQEFLRRKQPLTGGMVDVADVARAALFLLGGGARAMTGEVLTVDGGWKVTGV
jgi:NAD(P)-dependent dehydrogenase (short-subunit alcohol dehydrogenase family)